MKNNSFRHFYVSSKNIFSSCDDNFAFRLEMITIWSENWKQVTFCFLLFYFLEYTYFLFCRILSVLWYESVDSPYFSFRICFVIILNLTHLKTKNLENWQFFCILHFNYAFSKNNFLTFDNSSKNVHTFVIVFFFFFTEKCSSFSLSFESPQLLSIF